MTALAQWHQSLGARLAADNIPLDYGEQSAELAAAENGAILLDRSHEGRILLRGRDCLSLPNRMSTNDLLSLSAGEGTSTIFTTANARILFRALCLRIDAGLLLISEAGQGAALAAYLRRSIFFGDQLTIEDQTGQTAQFALHGSTATEVVKALSTEASALAVHGCLEIASGLGKLTFARRKPICGHHWLLICPAESASKLHKRLLQLGEARHLLPAGSLTYNSLRIRSGRPAGLELSADYLPLEVGLWDEVSFNKGCYTGQEIIARMESRARLAKTLVRVALSVYVPAPATVLVDGKVAGRLTSSAIAANGELLALAVLRVACAAPGTALKVGENELAARVIDYAGAQPSFITGNTESAAKTA
ncbi:MAG: aminomethyl transferase family protein [Chloroflexi bacterium]|nr:aminomethyl transferase family protein [Chloroflexota bacterium]